MSMLIADRRTDAGADRIPGNPMLIDLGADSWQGMAMEVVVLRY
jgi:hypothetical protein